MHSSRQHSGFTLIETLIALAIIAAIAALVLPATFAQLAAAKFDLATREVVLAADSCRSYAIEHSTSCRLVLTPGKNGVTIEMETPPVESDDQGADSSSRLLAATSPTATDRPSSRPPSPQDTPDRSSAHADPLYLVPDGLVIQRSAGEEAAPDSGSRTPDSSVASGSASASSGAASFGSSGSGGDRVVLAAFLPDGSMLGSPFELSGLSQRARFSILKGAGRLSVQRLELEAAAGSAPASKPSSAESPDQSVSQPQSPSDNAAQEGK